MMIPYTHTIRDEYGRGIIHDIEVELEIEASLYRGEPQIDIRGVWIDGKDILTCTNGSALKTIACDIVDEVENNDAIAEQALEWAEIYSTRRGGADCHWRYAP